MSDDGLDKFRIIGAHLRVAAVKLRGRLALWSEFSKSAGFVQWLKENPVTPEQLSAIEDGFKHLTIRARPAGQ